MTKPRVTPKLLREITRRIVAARHPQMIIFFGSRVYGQPQPDSDIDLLVVMNARGHWSERRRRIDELFRGESFKLDAHVYRPREVAHRLLIGDYFMQDVIERGRVVYQQNGRELARLFREKLRQGKEHPMNEEYIAEWIAKAEWDFKSARALARQRRDFSPDNLCWTCQQCVEKYLKAFLVRHRIKFERIHDLTKLEELCLSVDRDFRLITDAIKPLNECQPPIRYPGASVSAETARQAFDAMKQVRGFVRAKLGLR